jgi:hypothetical protein
MKRYDAAAFQSAMQGPDPRIAELNYLRSRLESAADVLPQSQPLTGTVFTERGPMEVEEALVTFEVGRVLYRFGTWVVTEDGIASLVHAYPLVHARLEEHQDWASLLAEQSWVNLWDLLRALLVVQHMGPHRKQTGGHGDGAHPS